MRTRHWLASSVAAMAAFGWSGTAHASADGGCSPDWSVSAIAFDGCSNGPALQPGNDTRANLLLMMLDSSAVAPSTARPVDAEKWYIEAYSPFLPWGAYREYYLPTGTDNFKYAGSRCSSNDSGSEAFIAAVTKAAGLADNERSALITARKGVTLNCGATSTPGIALAELTPMLTSAEAKGFGAYLEGVLAFYDGRQKEAISQFERAATAKNDWLKETARYMVARAALNEEVEGLYDRYGYRDEAVKVDAAKVKVIEGAFTAYLNAYPKGRYAQSARGLMRRVWWLGGDFTKLDAEYARLLADPKQSLADLAEEIDIKYLAEASTSQNPIILAAMDLARMRGEDLYGMKNCCAKPLTAADLAAQASIFSKHPSLYEYLQAAHALYVGKKPKEALRLIPDAAKQKEFSHVQFARQMLRGEALMASKDRNARGFFVEMLGGAKSTAQRQLVELAIAQYDEKNGQLSRVFAKGSPIQNPIIRRVLLQNSADAALLRQQAQNKSIDKDERELALYTLLKKQLAAGLYKPFLSDLAMLPPGTKPIQYGDAYVYGTQLNVPLGHFTGPVGGKLYPCPEIKAIATTLAANANDTKGQLCLAEFMRTRFEDYAYLDGNPEGGALGSTPSPLNRKPFSRMAIYQKLIADPKVTGDDKAYALHRAIRCFESSGYNHCGSQEIPTSQRKAWFQRLKRDYPNNPIATSLNYYW